MLGVSIVTRGLAAKTSATVPATLGAGPPGGEAAPGIEAPGAPGAAEGAAPFAGAAVLACVCDWCSR